MKLDRLCQSLLLTSAIAILIPSPAQGEEVETEIRQAKQNISQLSEIELPPTNARMLVQTPTNPSTLQG